MTPSMDDLRADDLVKSAETLWETLTQSTDPIQALLDWRNSTLTEANVRAERLILTATEYLNWTREQGISNEFGNALDEAIRAALALTTQSKE